MKRSSDLRDVLTTIAIVALVPLVLLTIPPGRARAQTGTVGVWGEAYDHETLTINAVSTPLTAAKVAPSGQTSASTVYITVETQPVRYWFDGTDPTATTGHQVKADGSFTVSGINNIRRLRMIQTAGGASTVVVTYFH